MNLDRTACRRARLARDPRFDGRFFVGVRTTGVFCRPICPAVAPQERNVTYFPTAAAAAGAGYRACLRCRPECAPGTPPWSGVSVTIHRALRLIGEGALEDASVEDLAARLGVGGRHLRRLFVEHLGATPVAVAQTRRLLSAKRLLDETAMPITLVAMAAGFGSIRRFNAAFRASYGRSPRELREARQGPVHGHQREAVRPAAPGRYVFQLRYRPPLDWQALLGFLAPRAIPGVEVVDHGAYRRVIEVDGETGWFEIAPAGLGTLDLSIEFPRPAQLLRIVARVRRLFDLDADPMAVDSHLAADPMLAPLVARRPGMRVPGAWDGFELGVRAILGQQVSVAAATTLAGRLVERFGRPLGAGAENRSGAPRTGPAAAAGLTHAFPGAASLARADVARIGLPGARGAAIRGLAGAVARGELRFGAEMDGAAFRERLRAVKGVGDWTVEYVALRALGDPDGFPSGDLGLMRATGAASPAALGQRAQAWRPWRGYAAMHLWTGPLQG